jgi:hypothetical protein
VPPPLAPSSTSQGYAQPTTIRNPVTVRQAPTSGNPLHPVADKYRSAQTGGISHTRRQGTIKGRREWRPLRARTGAYAQPASSRRPVTGCSSA